MPTVGEFVLPCILAYLGSTYGLLMRKQSIPCDNEAHEVAQCANAYVAWCEDGNADMAEWAKVRLQMFVNTTMRWKETCGAVSRSRMTPGAKRMMRVHERLGRRLTREEKAALRRAETTPKSDIVKV